MVRVTVVVVVVVMIIIVIVVIVVISIIIVVVFLLRMEDLAGGCNEEFLLPAGDLAFDLAEVHGDSLVFDFGVTWEFLGGQRPDTVAPIEAEFTAIVLCPPTPMCGTKVWTLGSTDLPPFFGNAPVGSCVSGNFSVSVVQLIMLAYSRVHARVLADLKSANDCVGAMRA